MSSRREFMVMLAGSSAALALPGVASGRSNFPPGITSPPGPRSDGGPGSTWTQLRDAGVILTVRRKVSPPDGWMLS